MKLAAITEGKELKPPAINLHSNFTMSLRLKREKSWCPKLKLFNVMRVVVVMAQDDPPAWHE